MKNVALGIHKKDMGFLDHAAIISCMRCSNLPNGSNVTPLATAPVVKQTLLLQWNLSSKRNDQVSLSGSQCFVLRNGQLKCSYRAINSCTLEPVWCTSQYKDLPLSLVTWIFLGTHIVKEKNLVPKVAFWSLSMLSCTHTVPHTIKKYWILIKQLEVTGYCFQMLGFYCWRFTFYYYLCFIYTDNRKKKHLVQDCCKSQLTFQGSRSLFTVLIKLVEIYVLVCILFFF